MGYLFNGRTFDWFSWMCYLTVLCNDLIIWSFMYRVRRSEEQVMCQVTYLHSKIMSITTIHRYVVLCRVAFCTLRRDLNDTAQVICFVRTHLGLMHNKCLNTSSQVCKEDVRLILSMPDPVETHCRTVRRLSRRACLAEAICGMWIPMTVQI